MGHRHTLIIVLVAAVSLAAVGWVALRRLPCVDRVGAFYVSKGQAIAEGAMDGGWIPESLPTEATDIHEEHDVDTHELWMRFRIPPARARKFTDSLRLLTRNDRAGVKIRPPCDRSWWFEGLIEQQPANDGALNADVYAGTLADAPGQVVVLVDRTSSTVYLWAR